MGWKIGLPSLKLNNAGVKSKSCGDFQSVAEEALKERKGHDPDIDKELAGKNVYTGFDTAAALVKYSQEHVEQLRDAKGRRLRKDAVVMCATILKPPADMMATLSEKEQKKFLDDAYNAFAAIVGAGRIKSRADHYDEQGAHTHVFWEPVTDDGRLCAKELHNLKFFGRVNREIPEKLRQAGWDIEDCKMYDAAEEEYKKEKEKSSGKSSYEYKAEAERAKRELEAKIEDLETKAAAAQQQLDESVQAANTASREAQEAQEQAAAIRAAVRPPEAVQAITVKKTMSGDVRLSQEDYEILKKSADGAALAKAAADELVSVYDELEAAQAEERALREQATDLRNQILAMQIESEKQRQRIARLEADNKKARVLLAKVLAFANGQAGIWSKLVRLIPGYLGQRIFLDAMTKITGVQFDDGWDFRDYVSMLERDAGVLLKDSQQLIQGEPENEKAR